MVWAVMFDAAFVSAVGQVGEEAVVAVVGCFGCHGQELPSVGRMPFDIFFDALLMTMRAAVFSFLFVFRGPWVVGGRVNLMRMIDRDLIEGCMKLA